MIVCIGDLMLDVLVRRQTGTGIEGVVAHLGVEAGGSAANVAAWLASIGAPVGLIAAVGQDLVGDLLLEDLRRRGVALAVARLDDQPSGILLLDTLPDGTTRPAARRGANNAIQVGDAQRALLAEARWLHVTAYAYFAEPSRAPVLEAVRLARGAGGRVSLDLGSPHLVAQIGEAAYEALLRATAPDLLMANEVEAARLAGEGGDPLAALAHFAPIAVLKRGPRGCTVRTGQDEFKLLAVNAPEVDPLGAGDAFAAGLIYALYQGRPLREAVTAGMALGAQCVSMLGGRPPRPA